MSSEKEPLVRIKPRIAARVKKLARQEERSFPKQVNTMLEENLKAHRKPRKIKP